MRNLIVLLLAVTFPTLWGRLLPFSVATGDRDLQPIAKNFYCGRVDPIPHGSIDISGAGGQEMMYPPGTQLQYHCKKGYYLKGAELRYCLLFGYWSEDPPTCVPDEMGKEEDFFENGKNLHNEGTLEPLSGVSYLMDDEDSELGSGEIDSSSKNEDLFFKIPALPSVFNLKGIGMQDQMKTLENTLKEILRQALNEASNFNGTTTNVTEEVEDEFGGKFKVQTIVKKGDNNNTMIVETIEAIQAPVNRTKRSNWFAESYQ